ncbi:hypothetical protein EB118_17775 [bacterium]|nr:hypothetical protein [bacterium]
MVAINEDVSDTVLSVRCNMCSADHVIFVKMHDYIEWKNGAGFIQDLMPYLSNADRELLISGTCGPCFDSMFPS